VTDTATTTPVAGEERVELAKPYKGLDFYTDSAADAFVFFGRESESKLIGANLIASRFTVLYGPSGVGKSSVLHAGVAFELRNEAELFRLTEGPPRFVVAIFRSWPGDPVAGLLASVEDAVREGLGELPCEPVPEGLSLSDALAAWSDRLGGELLIVLDQFEELFLYPTARARFVDEFAHAVTRSDLRANFLVSIREDALALLDVFKTRIPGLFESYMRIDHLSRESAKVAIEQPIARYVGGFGRPGEPTGIEPELVEELLTAARVEGAARAGASADPVDTVKLQLVLTRLWDAAVAEHAPMLQRSTLEALGGAQNIVRTHLEEAIEQLEPDERAAAARAFVHLVTPAGRKISLSLDELAGNAKVDPDALRPVLDKLVRARVLNIDQREQPRYEISHDSLARAVLDWRQRFEAEQELAERDAAERERAKQERRRRKMLIGWGVAAALIVAVLATSTAWYVAWQQSNDASDQRDLATSRLLASRATLQQETNPELALLTAETGVWVRAEPETVRALRRAVARAPVHRIISRIDGSYSAVALSPDGRHIATGDRHGAVRVRDARSGGLEQVLLEPSGARVHRLAYSANGKRLLAAVGSTIHLWEADGSSVATSEQRAPVRSAAIAADGKTIVVSTSDGTTRVSSIASSRAKPVFTVPAGKNVNDVAISSRGRFVATVASKPRLWEVGVKEVTLVAAPRSSSRKQEDSPSAVPLPRRQLAPAQPSSVEMHAVAFSRDGRFVLAGDDRGATSVWRVKDGSHVATVRGHRKAIRAASFTALSSRAITGSSDGVVRITDPDRPAAALRMTAPGPVAAVSAAASSGEVAVAGPKGAFTWIPGGEPDSPLALDGSLRTAVVARDGRAGLLVGLGNGESQTRVRIVDLQNRAVISAFALQDASYAAAVSADGRRFAIAPYESERNEIPIFDRRGKQVATVPFEETYDVALSPNGSRLVAVGLYDASLFDVGSGKETPLPGDFISTYDVKFSPDGRYIATPREGRIVLWNRAGKRVRALGPVRGDINAIAFSPDSGRLAAAGADGLVRVWSLATGKLRTYDNGGPLLSIAFSRNGRLIVTGGRDGRVAVWGAGRGSATLLAAGPGQEAWAVAFVGGDRGVVAVREMRGAFVRCPVCGGTGDLRRFSVATRTMPLTHEGILKRFASR
jgi:WD40 repeat protein